MQTNIDQIAKLVSEHNHKAHKRWPKKIKTLVLDFHRASGISINKIGELVGIHPKNIYLWSQKSVRHSASSTTPKNLVPPKQSAPLIKAAKRLEPQVIEVKARGKLIHIVICLGSFEMRIRWG